MKIYVKKYTSILITLITVNLYANENWITFKPINNTQKQNVNLSQIEPINRMMKNFTLIEQIIKATSKKETKRETLNDKKWFVITTQTK